jgi:hypothetical protein
MLEATTKPNGSGRNWLEIGQFITDEFGDEVWQHDEARYPQHDPALTVKRDYDGRGNSQQIHWKIIVPEGYTKTIVKRWADGSVERIRPK